MSESSTNLSWAASDKLKDSTNYAAWKSLIKQALINADVYEFVLGEGDGKEPDTKDSSYSGSTTYGKWLKGNAKAYMILHRTCGSEPARTIKSTENASTAWTLLKERYEGKGFFLSDQYLVEFEALSFEKTRDIAAFNALFKDLKVKLQECGTKNHAQWYIQKYLRWVSPAFPAWAERQRSIIRDIDTITTPLTEEKLDKMMADLIDENRAITVQDENASTISLYGNRPQYQKGNSNYQKKLNT
jgi:hypothetical protein